jgi:hypothetical protein
MVTWLTGHTVVQSCQVFMEMYRISIRRTRGCVLFVCLFVCVCVCVCVCVRVCVRARVRVCVRSRMNMCTHPVVAFEIVFSAIRAFLPNGPHCFDGLGVENVVLNSSEMIR